MISPQTSNLHRGQTLTCLFKSAWSLCHTPQFPSPKAVCQVRCETRGMLVISVSNTVHSEFVPQGETVNVELYSNFLGLPKKNIQQTWCELWCMSACHLLSAQSTLKNTGRFGTLTSFASLQFYPFYENGNQVKGLLLWRAEEEAINTAEPL